MIDEQVVKSTEVETVADAESAKPKSGRTNGKNSSYISGGYFIPNKLKFEIEQVLQKNRDLAAFKKKKVGSATQNKREVVIKGFFSDLLRLGFKIKSIYNLKEKHLIVVFNHLEKQGQSPATIQNKISIIRIFCGWIGKRGMVRNSTHYVINNASVMRTTVVQEDKSWQGKGVDVVAKLSDITRKDFVVGIWLELCWAFGLRVSEAIMIKPCMSHEGDFILVRQKTKGGRPRVVPVENDVQKDVLERAKKIADGKTGIIGYRGKTFKQKLRRVYTVLESLGITLKEEGISAHGLRHQYMHESFKRLTGVDAPIRGGDLSKVEKDELIVATLKLVERAGHSRASIGSAYYGSRRIKSKTSNETNNQNKEYDNANE